jgi:hypothetical protein
MTSPLSPQTRSLIVSEPTAFAILLPTNEDQTEMYLSSRFERDLSEYALLIPSQEAAERILETCEPGSMIVEHPYPDGDQDE